MNGIRLTIVDNRNYVEREGMVIPAGKCGNTIEIVPYEFHLSSDRLMDIFTVLGITMPYFKNASEYSGQCDGRTITEAIKRFKSECPKGNPIGCPSMDDASFYWYLVKLLLLAGEAEKREELVMWD